MDTHVTVELHGNDSETFGYGAVRLQRNGEPARWSLLDKQYWLATLPGVPLCYLLGPYFLAGFLGATHAVELSRWLANHGSRHRLGLHSGDPHGCAQLTLPRDSKLRCAILDEFARRFAKNLGVRQPGLLSLRKRRPHLARGSRVPDFALAALDGEPWNPSKLRGNVVLLSFRASWCEPRRQEMPQLSASTWAVNYSRCGS